MEEVFVLDHGFRELHSIMAGRHGEADEWWECVAEAYGKHTEHDRKWMGKTFKGPALEIYFSQLGSTC